MNEMRNDIEKMVRIALIKLYENDKYLITNTHVSSPGKDGHVSERGIVVRFAIYLQELMYNSAIKDYNLDVEYNRNMGYLKCLPNTDWEKYGAFPDLIIHKRGNNDSNLLVIEFKTHWNKNKTDVKLDIDKLKAFIKEPYAYKKSLFVMLNENEPKLFWIYENTTIDEIMLSIKR